MLNKFNDIAAEIGQIVTEKNAAYGDSVADTAGFLRLLWPNGIPVEAYGDIGLLVRIWDKQKRIANRKDAFGESPYQDIAGYGILGVGKDVVGETESSEIKDLTVYDP